MMLLFQKVKHVIYGYLNVTCQNPDCQSENAFHNGINYECPDCDYEWD